ncbi:MAG TPA: polyprenol monophosphomannose synthase [Chitinophagaceae bacterium]|nr:polyprenol monophosphomannose synthase [Chitinophagaceae bacterium]
MKYLVIIPTYNEKENIEAIIRAIWKQPTPFDILVVDDGSPDGTAQIVKSIQKDHSDSLFIIERTGKLGLGTAYITGFKWALEHGYDYIIEMDADFSHPPERLNDLVAAANEGADVAIGSRYVKGGSVKNWPFRRILISYGASLYTRMITWMPVRDCTAGFVLYKKEVLSTIPLDKVRFVGYAFQIEMKYLSWKNGFKIKEVPICFVDRVKGQSKMSKNIIKEAIFGVWKMKFTNYKK